MSAPRVLMIGWDAADRRTIESWIADGTLPTLAALRGRGRAGRIADLPGLGDDAAWGSFATGTEPGVHGRFHHRQIIPGTYRLDNFFRPQMIGDPFWARLGAAGRRVAVLDVPKSPLGDGPNVVQLADWLPHGEDGQVPVSRPPAVAAALPARFRVPPGFSCHESRTGVGELAALRDRVREHLALRTALAAAWLAQEPWDLFLTVFAESHCIGHHCWHLHDLAHPRHDPAARAALGDPVRDIHRELDTALARLIERCGPETTVIVFSLMGMTTTYLGSQQLVDAVLRRLDGRDDGDGFRARSRRVLARLRGRGEGALGESSAFAVHTNSIASAIRVNLAGREPNGRVAADAYEEYCRLVATGFRSLVDPATGRRVVKDVVRVADRYPGPRAAAFADLLVVWDASAPITAVGSEAVGVVENGPPTDPAGNHRPGGWFVAAGPDIMPGEVPRPAAIVDVAPTVATLCGVTLRDSAGSPIGLS